MLDEGIRGEFEESNYDESELSKIEVKWKRFLQDSAMAKQNLESEKNSGTGKGADQDADFRYFPSDKNSNGKHKTIQ